MTDDLKPELSEDEKTHFRGQEAESFIRFFDEGQQYFKGVMDSIQQEIKDEIMGLSPHETEKFTVLKARLESLYVPLERVAQDVRIGKLAWMRMQGIVDRTEGIL